MKKFNFNKYLVAFLAVGAIAIIAVGIGHQSNLSANTFNGLVAFQSGAPSMGAPSASPPDWSSGSTTVPIAGVSGIPGQGTGTDTIGSTTSNAQSDSYAGLPTTPHDLQIDSAAGKAALIMRISNKFGVINVPTGTAVTLTWNSSSDYATYPYGSLKGPCTPSWQSTTVGTGGSQTVTVKDTTTYTLTCGDTSASVTATVLPAVAPAFTVTALANDKSGDVSVPYYGNVKLSATSSDPNRIASCYVSYPDPGGKTFSTFSMNGLPSDFRFPNIIENKSYTVNCTSFSGEKAQSTVKVSILAKAADAAPLTATLTFNGQTTLTVPYTNSNSVYNNQKDVDVAWSTNKEGTVCTIGSNDSYGLSGAFIGIPTTASGTAKGYYYINNKQGHWYFGLTCKRQDETVKAQAEFIIGNGVNSTGDVHMKDVTPVKLTGNSQSGTITVNSGDNVLLQWNASDYGTADCNASGDWSGRKATPNGQEFTGQLYTNKSYTLTCLHATQVYEAMQQKTSDTVTVYVSGSSSSGGGTTITKPCVIPNDGHLHLPCPGTPPPAPAPSPVPAPVPVPQPSPTAKIPPAGFEDTVIVDGQNPFPDINSTSLVGKAATELYRRGVLGGYPDGEFKGGLEVNRAQAAKFLLLAKLQTVEDLQNTGKFRDVLDGQWYVKFVIKAANLGIIQGYPDGKFKPQNSVKTGEFLKMLTKTFGLQENLKYTYTDVQSTDWFAPYAGVAQKYELFPDKGMLLKPDQNLTRDDVAVAIYQYLKNK